MWNCYMFYVWNLHMAADVGAMPMQSVVVNRSGFQNQKKWITQGWELASLDLHHTTPHLQVRSSFGMSLKILCHCQDYLHSLTCSLLEDHSWSLPPTTPASNQLIDIKFQRSIHHGNHHHIWIWEAPRPHKYSCTHVWSCFSIDPVPQMWKEPYSR